MRDDACGLLVVLFFKRTLISVDCQPVLSPSMLQSTEFSHAKCTGSGMVTNDLMISVAICVRHLSSDLYLKYQTVVVSGILAF